MRRQVLPTVILGVLCLAIGWSMGTFSPSSLIWAQRNRRQPATAVRTTTTAATSDQPTVSAKLGGESLDPIRDLNARIEIGRLSSGTPVNIRGWEYIDELSAYVAYCETVFWDPRDTLSLRSLIARTPLVQDKTILEIGTGSGLVALCCLQAGAKRVVATDVNAAAIANAVYNARRLGLDNRLDARLVPLDRPAAYSVIAESEKFDVIISNPPWEDRKPKRIDDYALFDQDFALLRSLLKDLRVHLHPGGAALLAYGSGEAITCIKRLAVEYGLGHETIADNRDLKTLPTVFVPGMLLEIVPR